MIILCSVFSIFTTVGAMSLHIWSIYGVNPNNSYYCTSFIPKASSTSYVFGNAAQYQFFNARSECVRTAAESSSAFRNLRRLTILLANLVPLLSIFAIVFWGGELVDVNGKFFCVDSPVWQLATMFAILALNASLLFLLLFIWPLRMHYKMMEKNQMIRSSDSESSNPILVVIKKNLTLSCFAITSTVFSMVFLCVVGTNPNVQRYAHNLSANCAQADLCINLICMTLMTNTWLPPSLRRKKNKTSSGGVIISKTAAMSSNNEANPHHAPAQSTASIQQQI